MNKTLREFKETINEGGNAVPDVVPINQENSIPTVNKIYSEIFPLLKIKKSDTALLGSTGKKAPGATSGDIDIAISSESLLASNKVTTFNDIIDTIVAAIKKKGYAYKDMRSIGIVSFAFPIENYDKLQAGHNVQVDFMVVQDVKYAAFSFYSPSYLESEFKGLYRNELNFYVAKAADLQVKKIDPATNIPVEWSRYWYDNTKGLMKGVQTNLSPKTGKIVKNVTSLEKETVSFDPDVIVEFLYGKGVKAKDVMTFENTLKVILSSKFPNPTKRKIILKNAADGIIGKGYPVPEILAKHL